MKKTYFKTIIMSLLLASFLPACKGGKQTDKAATSDSIKITQVELSPVVEQTISQDEELTTVLEAKVKNNISAQTGGRLAQLLVAVGDRVRRGQVLARLEATQLATAQIQLKDAQTNLQRMDEVYKAGGVSRAQWEQAKSAVLVAQEQVRNLAENTALRSPISGVVTAKNYDNGDMTSPSLPIVVIEQISPLKAVVKVSESLYSKLKKGVKASLKTEALGESVFEGQISNIFPTIDKQTHTITVEVEFANKQQELRPGMFGRVTFDLGERQIIAVPDRAVMRLVGAGTRYVYVAKDGKAEYRVVTLGSKFGDVQEITSGLAVGEQVIVKGQAKLTNGAPIKG